ncbi:MAG: hypothetical protein HY273_08310 [Gammaproteobacteria bacterium]|nr:hypothetical protein [Gammaproteobacteria bacterium]
MLASAEFIFTTKVYAEADVELKLVRGIVSDLAVVEKSAQVTCRVGEMPVRLHRDLSTAAKAGDEVLIGGELQHGVVLAFAMKNFTRKKLSTVDFTFHILGAGLGGIFTMFGAISYGQSSPNTFSAIQVLYLVLLSVGSVIVFFSLQRIPRILKLTRWVANENE